jgi:hypothetical protein
MDKHAHKTYAAALQAKSLDEIDTNDVLAVLSRSETGKAETARASEDGSTRPRCGQGKGAPLG